MKKIHLLFFSLLFSVSAFSQSRSLKDVVGVWQMEGNFGALEFIDSTHVVTIMNGKKVGGGTYIMDFTKNPIWLDVNIKQGGRSMTIKQILEFVDDDTIRWQSSVNNERPKQFEQTQYGAPLRLTRKKS